jgi:O-antigen biosynthesis protein
MNSTATPPLASVIVRTLGRDCLPRALSSIANQSHRPLEIVLVDAAGEGLSMSQHERIPVRVVNRGPLDRPRAANAGLEAARGAWITFLDDDDEVDRDHVALLIATAALAGLPVAYSQTRLLDPDGSLVRVFGGPYSREALLRSNYLAIHSVLFHRQFVDAGVRFDETLATFEDWDFWLQLSARTDFAFSGKPTASYRAAAGASGAGAGANLDRDAALAQRERLMRKWQAP